ncbi:hypothetical protein BSIN_3813 [Burkholderia singularis]|uniref:Uncharacterized protein n=1 Tax=Burkholderia singularis TaxID=1503053 RepID=A0A238H675_9BURK|nr:hypothetical protein BSIN_3813 [Burkholderia singularis]
MSGRTRQRFNGQTTVAERAPVEVESARRAQRCQPRDDTWSNRTHDGDIW